MVRHAGIIDLNMPLDIGAVQKALAADGLDAWLLYDFHGSNPVSYRIAGMGGAGHLATRRWFYLIPQSGEPRALVHAIERHNLDHLPGSKTVYAGRAQLHAGLDQDRSTGCKRVAMDTRRTARSLTCRASMPGPSSSSDRSASTSRRPAI